MAMLSATPYPGVWGITKDWAVDIKRDDDALAAIDAAQPDPNASSLVGARLDFPRGDGYAVYVVTKDRPLTLAHVPYGDAWQADECTLRGVNAPFVRRMLRSRIALRRLFSAPKKGT